MNKYDGMTCPICHAKFFDDDEIVVCPECGAPHHKQCWQSLKHCAFEKQHGTPEQWTMPVIEPESVPEAPPQSSTSQDDNKTPFLGGNVFINPDDDSDEDFEQSQEDLLSEQLLHIEGVNKDEKIDDVDTVKIAAFVGYNAARYLRVFKEMAFTGAKTGWNWFAFLIPQYWLISRKCYKAGALTTAYSLFSSLMISIMQGANGALTTALTKAYSDPSMLFTNPLLLTYIGLMFGSLIIRIFIGLFGDYIYKKTVFSGIRAIILSEDYKITDFFRKGGVNLMLPIAVYFAINLISVIVLSLI